VVIKGRLCDDEMRQYFSPKDGASGEITRADGGGGDIGAALIWQAHLWQVIAIHNVLPRALTRPLLSFSLALFAWGWKNV
jgi:hypothetical protein